MVPLVVTTLGTILSCLGGLFLSLAHVDGLRGMPGACTSAREQLIVLDHQPLLRRRGTTGYASVWHQMQLHVTRSAGCLSDASGQLQVLVCGNTVCPHLSGRLCPSQTGPYERVDQISRPIMYCVELVGASGSSGLERGPDAQG